MAKPQCNVITAVMIKAVVYDGNLNDNINLFLIEDSVHNTGGSLHALHVSKVR